MTIVPNWLCESVSETEADEDTESEQAAFEVEKHSVRGLIKEDEVFEEAYSDFDLDELFTGSENKMVVVPVTYETYSALTSLDCFVSGGVSEKDAVNFVKRYSSKMRLYVEISVRMHENEVEGGSENLEVRVHSISSTGELTNEVVEDFVSQFRFEIHSEFDPLAENHEEPYLEVFVPRGGF